MTLMEAKTWILRDLAAGSAESRFDALKSISDQDMQDAAVREAVHRVYLEDPSIRLRQVALNILKVNGVEVDVAIENRFANVDDLDLTEREMWMQVMLRLDGLEKKMERQRIASRNAIYFLLTVIAFLLLVPVFL